MPGKTQMTSRIPVRPETLERVKDFTKGVNADNYDEAINLVLDLIAAGKEDLIAGYELRSKLEESKRDQQ